MRSSTPALAFIATLHAKSNGITNAWSFNANARICCNHVGYGRVGQSFSPLFLADSETVFSFGDDDDNDDEGDFEVEFYDSFDGNEDEEELVVQGDKVLFSSEWENGVEPTEHNEKSEKKKDPWWSTADPELKERIAKRQREKAIRNKKKREPNSKKKRDFLQYARKTSRRLEYQSRVERPLPLANRTLKLSDMYTGMSVNGTVISLVEYGAYVDVGTECDGLLHVSQITRDPAVSTFVSHPREVLSPGDVLPNLKVVRVCPDSKKLQLTNLGFVPEVLSSPESGSKGRRSIRATSMALSNHNKENGFEDDYEERIKLDEIDIDDELWGTIVRVTNYGAYVEVGATVDGFLHFMDHPYFNAAGYEGAHPSSYMEVGQRIRVWVMKVDTDAERVQLTALRPSTLPVLRRERVRVTSR